MDMTPLGKTITTPISMDATVCTTVLMRYQSFNLFQGYIQATKFCFRVSALPLDGRAVVRHPNDLLDADSARDFTRRLFFVLTSVPRPLTDIHIIYPNGYLGPTAYMVQSMTGDWVFAVFRRLRRRGLFRYLTKE
jgi:hypothetical protein